MIKCPYHVYNVYTYKNCYIALPGSCQGTSFNLINHWPLKKIHNCLSDSENSFLFFLFYFSCMVAITAAVLTSTLVNGLQHNQIHVTKRYF